MPFSMFYRKIENSVNNKLEDSNGNITDNENSGEVEDENISDDENSGDIEEEKIEIIGFSEARDFIAAYFLNQYGIEQIDPWMEQDLTPEGLVGSSTFRYVSGLMTIKISAPIVALSATVYTIEEASFIANGFYWEGTLSYDGTITETLVILPGTILNEELARDAVLEYLVATYELSEFGEWDDQGFSQTGNDTLLIVYTASSWIVEVEFAPAAPLISIYQVSVENSSDGMLWEGDITLHGVITEVRFTQ